MGEMVRKFRCGIVVRPSPESVKEGIEEFFERRRDEFSEGLERLKREFSIENSSERFLREI
jgi:glycosyltransferase involved in cell wall biosynthesis